MKFTKTSIAALIFALFFLFACEKQEPLTPNAGETGSAETEGFLKGGNGKGQVTVMTWNIYVGADVDVVLGATDPNEIPVLVAAAYQELLSTNFEERAGTIARFIKKHKPHVIGLQEVSLIQRFSDVPPGPGNLVEQFDYLEILLNKLEALGLNYEVAGKVDNIDVTVPMLINPSPLDLDYVRLLDSDVILARHDVQISDVITANYQAALPVPSFGISIPRGYVSVKARIERNNYRVVSTHLESFTEEVRFPQAQELVGILANESLPIIMMGDFNTPAPSSLVPDGSPTYQFLVDESVGYTDIWPLNLISSEGEGFTASQDSDLRNPVSLLDRRIDFIFVRSEDGCNGHNEIGPVQARVLGDELNERTPSGMWPSDHAGVVAKLQIKKHRHHAAQQGEPITEEADY